MSPLSTLSSSREPLSMSCPRRLSPLLLLSIAARSDAFVTRPARSPSLVAVRGVPFFADEPAPTVGEVLADAEPPADDVLLSTFSGGGASIREAAEFMVDSFWLRSPQNLVVGGDDPSGIADGARSSLIAEQEDDLARKYGDLMGARRLRSGLIRAADGEGLLGLVGVEMTLLDSDGMQVLSAERSEALLKNAVASLGPKQRREYKGSAASELADQLLPANLVLIVALSNLSVSPRARRRGVAARLCREAERVAKDDWGFAGICLQVEEGNAAARNLYEGKLGYAKAASSAVMGLRANVKTGKFEEVPTETLLLTKKL